MIIRELIISPQAALAQLRTINPALADELSDFLAGKAENTDLDSLRDQAARMISEMEQSGPAGFSEKCQAPLIQAIATAAGKYLHAMPEA